jgi:hypothetical protein
VFGDMEAVNEHPEQETNVKVPFTSELFCDLLLNSNFKYKYPVSYTMINKLKLEKNNIITTIDKYYLVKANKIYNHIIMKKITGINIILYLYNYFDGDDIITNERFIKLVKDLYIVVNQLLYVYDNIVKIKWENN